MDSTVHLYKLVRTIVDIRAFLRLRLSENDPEDFEAGDPLDYILRDVEGICVLHLISSIRDQQFYWQ